MNRNPKVSFDELFPIIQEELAHGRSFSFTAFGNSMSPTIRGGVHRVTLSPLREEPKVGDILFYRRENGIFVLHRLCRIAHDGSFVFCGDNQYVQEKGIKRDQLIAKLTKLEKGEKEIFLHTLYQKLFTAMLPLRRFSLHAFSFFKQKIKALFT